MPAERAQRQRHAPAQSTSTSSSVSGAVAFAVRGAARGIAYRSDRQSGSPFAPGVARLGLGDLRRAVEQLPVTVAQLVDPAGVPELALLGDTVGVEQLVGSFEDPDRGELVAPE